MSVFGGVRGLAQAFMRSGISRGLTATQTVSSLRQAGLAYRRTDMLRDYREWAQVPMKAPAIKGVRRDYLISKELYISTTGKQTAPFRYQVGGSIYNPETKERVPFSTNVVSKIPLTPEQVYVEALEPIKKSTEAYKSDIEHYVIEAAFYKAGKFED